MILKEIEELAGHRQVPAWVVKLVADAVAIEREACAMVAYDYTVKVSLPNFFESAEYVAAAIRARGDAPPKKEWVGLTKEEAKEITLANRPYVIDVVAALEAKLKEKNHGNG